MRILSNGYPLMLICVILFVAHISSASTKKKSVHRLRDETNVVRDVQPGEKDISDTQNSPKPQALSPSKSRIPLRPIIIPTINDTSSVVRDVSPKVEMDSASEKPEALTNRDKHDDSITPGDNINDEHFKRIIAVTSLETYKGYLDHSKKHGLSPWFLVYGSMTVIKKIVEKITNSSSKYYIHEWPLQNALVLSVKGGMLKRANDLLEIAWKRIIQNDFRIGLDTEMTKFGTFINSFFQKLAPEHDGTSIKKFIIYNEKDHDGTFSEMSKIFYQELVRHLKNTLSYSNAGALLSELTKLSSRITPKMFAKLFLNDGAIKDRHDFIKYGWREAIDEGLGGDYPFGGKRLWKTLVDSFDGQFSMEYPPAIEIRTEILKTFPTKTELEKQADPSSSK